MPYTFTPPSRENLADLDKRLYAKATPERLAKYAFVKPHRQVIATHQPSGIRSRFSVAEHENLGPGYMMQEMDGRLPGIVSDGDLEDMVPVQDPLDV